MTTLTAERKHRTSTAQTCCECGAVGFGMIANYYYVGGQGDVRVYECPSCIDKRLEASQRACDTLKLAMMLGKS